MAINVVQPSIAEAKGFRPMENAQPFSFLPPFFPLLRFLAKISGRKVIEKRRNLLYDNHIKLKPLKYFSPKRSYTFFLLSPRKPITDQDCLVIVERISFDYFFLYERYKMSERKMEWRREGEDAVNCIFSPSDRNEFPRGLRRTPPIQRVGLATPFRCHSNSRLG